MSSFQIVRRSAQFAHRFEKARSAAAFIILSTLYLATVPAPSLAATSEVLYNFQYPTGYAPSAPLTHVSGNTFYGVARLGGPAGGGTVFAATTATVTSKGATSTRVYVLDIYNFAAAHKKAGVELGSNPTQQLILAPDGNLYGTTSSGGANGVGTLFQLAPATQILTVICSLPVKAKGLTAMVSDGSGTPQSFTLYSSSRNGGTTGKGTIYSVSVTSTSGSKPSATLTDLCDFDNTLTLGISPNALCLGPNNVFYGTTSSGGFAGNGTLFLFDPVQPAGSNLKVLHYFTPPDGFNPNSQLTFDGDNNLLYGTTVTDGSTGNGTVFSATAAGIVIPVHIFTFADGQTPNYVTYDPGTKVIYGTTKGGGIGSGSFFTLDPVSSVLTPKYAFPFHQGKGPTGVTLLGDNKYMFTCSAGGANGNGSTLYGDLTSSPALWTQWPFSAPTGTFPASALVETTIGGVDGLFGTTSEGGDNNTGTVFEYTVGAIQPTTAFSFDRLDPSDSNQTGAFPSEELISDGVDHLFGTTELGGKNGTGTAFNLTLHPSSGTWTEATFSFDRNSVPNTNGSYPHCALVAGLGGLYYGTTLFGGAGGAGTIFSVDFSASPLAVNVLHSFAGPDSTGDYPEGVGPNTLHFDPATGHFYGTTEGGGAFGYGTIFDFNPANSLNPASLSVLHDFDFLDGAGSSAALSEIDGELLGSTQYGGPGGLGTLFSLDLGEASFTTLASFDPTQSSVPTSSVLIVPESDSSGSFKSDTPRGHFLIAAGLFEGSNPSQSAGKPAAGGAFISIDPTTNSQEQLDQFTGSNGSNPNDELLYGSDGYFYGTTQFGGVGYGTLIRITDPVVNDLAPGSVKVGQEFTLTIFGSGFVAGSVVKWHAQGQPPVNLTPSSIGPGSVTTVVPAAANVATGPALVQIVAPDKTISRTTSSDSNVVMVFP